MRRYHEERFRMIREHRLHLRQVHGWPKRPVHCACELQVGRFRKRKAMGCGKPRCLVCHWSKVLDLPAIKDLVRLDRARDSLEDYVAESRDECRFRFRSPLLPTGGGHDEE